MTTENNAIPNEFLKKLDDIKNKFDAITKQVEEGKDEQKRLQGEYRVTIELGMKLGYLTEVKPEESETSPEVQAPEVEEPEEEIKAR